MQAGAKLAVNAESLYFYESMLLFCIGLNLIFYVKSILLVVYNFRLGDETMNNYWYFCVTLFFCMLHAL